MRKTPVLLFFLLIPSLLFAAITEPGKQPEIQPEGTPLRKLQRGFLNVALSPIDISNELAKEKTRQTFPPSWIAGLGRGAAFAAGRAIAGAFEMATFWRPSAPVVEPEFAWQHLEKKETPKRP